MAKKKQAKKLPKLQKRQWLNTDPAMVSCIGVDFEQYSIPSGVDGYLTIRDCSKTVALDFRIGNKSELKKSRRKLKIIKGMIEDIEKYFDEHESIINSWGKKKA